MQAQAPAHLPRIFDNRTNDSYLTRDNCLSGCEEKGGGWASFAREGRLPIGLQVTNLPHSR